jgi:FixJ family two-component response regulator
MTEAPVEPRVYVVDDELEVRKGLERLLRSAGFPVAVFGSAQEFLAQVGHDAPGCVVLDYQMPGLSGLELQAVLASRGVPIQIVFLSGHGDIPKSVQAIQGGAVDFLEKPASKELLFAAVTRALKRDAQGRRVRAELDDARARLAELTPREREVMTHVIAGRLNKQIAGLLGTAEKTVKIQRAAVMRKMGVRSVADLVRSAEKAGLEPLAVPPREPAG